MLIIVILNLYVKQLSKNYSSFKPKKTNENLIHLFRGMQWSDCSIKQIRFFLGTPAAQCLQNKPRCSAVQNR